MRTQRAIVIHSSSEDAHGLVVRDRLNERGAPVVFLAQEECFNNWAIGCVDHIPQIENEGTTLYPRDVGVVLWRQDYSCSPPRLVASEPDIGRFVAEQRERHAYGVWHTLERLTPFVNPVTAHRQAQSKTYQQYLARSLGLIVPKTYAGSNRHSAEAFARSLWADGRRCCTKNIEATRFTMGGRPHARMTQLFEPQHLGQLETLHLCPLIFQEYIEKKWEYRVTVVGDRVFPCLIDSQVAGGETAIDWRHYDLPRTPHKACSLPEQISDTLVRLLRALNLGLGAFDLVHSTSDEIVFLEVNTLGSWLWIEDLVGLPITEAVVDHLITQAGAHTLVHKERR